MLAQVMEAESDQIAALTANDVADSNDTACVNGECSSGHRRHFD